MVGALGATLLGGDSPFARQVRVHRALEAAAAAERWRFVSCGRPWAHRSRRPPPASAALDRGAWSARAEGAAPEPSASKTAVAA